MIGSMSAPDLRSSLLRGPPFITRNDWNLLSYIHSVMTLSFAPRRHRIGRVFASRPQREKERQLEIEAWVDVHIVLDQLQH